MPAPDKIKQLVERFALHRDDYQNPSYLEAQLRQEFIDPMFECLGWDMDNRQGFAQAYKEVIHEDSIRIGGVSKAPDYCFRIGGTRKFFLEAKKPAEKIDSNKDHAFQLRRYAWSAKLPLSILTDFEELAVYDCRFKPDRNDKPTKGRILFFKFEEYVERWDEIASVFSREAIPKGSFDRFAHSAKSKRGTSEVDGEFLKEIENWRLLLAKNLAKRNDELDQRSLNFAVQRIIDRIVFLRIAEDRGIEDYGKLQALQNGSKVYSRLTQLFHAADDRYNSGLFHFTKEKGRQEAPDDLTTTLKVDDDVLKEIFKTLYYPESPYEFSVFAADILGQVYEQFLGKVIRLTAGHQAKVEEKPEVKKAGGVYYTPTFIVEYIVQQTLGKLIEGKTPKHAAKLKVLDPACGSGSFLIGAFQFLLDWHRDWYVENDPKKFPKDVYQHKDGWRLTTAKRKEILLNSIYGVDIDSQAVEVTKLSLLLKVLEGENKETIDRQKKLFHQRALPDLGDNIKCGNSLIGPDFYDEHEVLTYDDDEQHRINAFDWKSEFQAIFKNGGFDVVVGNPPYDVLEKQRGAASWPHVALATYVRKTPEYAAALGGKLNLFRFFLTRSVNLNKASGRFGMIVPLALLADISCSASRRHLVEHTDNLEAYCFPQKDNPAKRIFVGAKLSTVVVAGTIASTPSLKKKELKVSVYPANRFTDESKDNVIKFSDAGVLDPANFPIPLTDRANWALCLKLHKHKSVKRLAEISDFFVTRGEINQTVYREFIRPSSEGNVPLLKGVQVGRYRLNEKLSQGSREWFAETAFEEAGNVREISKRRRIATQRITGVDERLRIVATIVDPLMYFADSTNSVGIQEKSQYSLEYLLGLMNSTLFQWRFKLTSTNNNVGTNELLAMPIRCIDFTSTVQTKQYDRFVQLVSNALSLQTELQRAKTAQSKTLIERQIAHVDGQIDDIVFALYGLSEAEIARVKLGNVK